MATPSYPIELPMLSQFKLTPFPQVLSTDTDIGPKSFRRRSRQLGAFAAVEFRFLETEYSIFVEWFKTDLLYGHKWFWIPLPGPNGIGPLLARFVGKPSATLGGHRFWTVTGILEIPDRFQVINYPILTSLVYPIEVIENFDVSSIPLVGNLTDSIGSIDVLSNLISSVLTTTIAYIQIYASPEQFDVACNLVAGLLTVTIAYQQFQAPPELFDVSSNLLSGVLTTTINYIIHYDPATDETFDVASDLVSGVLT